jgi:phospholipase C
MRLRHGPRVRHVTLALTLAVGVTTALAFEACGPAKGSHDEEGRVSYAAPQTMSATAIADGAKARESHAIKTVFVIVMENHDWDSIAGNPSAPYINGTLLKLGAHAERYTSPFDIHPSEPNYIWMEAADDLGIRDDDDPAFNYRTTKNHLTRHMETAGISWKSYQEAIDPGFCPIASSGRYGAKHNPMVYFDDVTDGRDPYSAHCLAHVRPYEELARDLETGAVAQYNFITPDMCNDMHDSEGCVTEDSVKNGDTWLANEVPKILASKAYREGGAIFITWDESEGGEDEPIGMIALSPFAKPGYANQIRYNHSSLVRTVQDVFAMRPYMRDAANVTGLEDLFLSYP